MAYTVLVVDDSRTVQKMMTKTLEMSGVPLNELQTAANGKEALDVMQDHWVDLVLTDINMPEMDGIELIRHMSDDGLMDSVPVIVVSTEGSEERIQELKERGISGYIRKPFTPEAIKDAVQTALGG